MNLSLRGLKEYLIEKEGYSITPEHNHLQNLKSLLDDMYDYRSQNTCTSHVGTEYIGELSLGDMYSAGSNLTNCTCNINTGTTCNCVSRSSTSTCTCNVDTYCDCRSRTYAAACTCHARTRSAGICDCVTRTGISSCYCYFRTGSCSCVSRTSLAKCTCNGRCSCNVDVSFG